MQKYRELKENDTHHNIIDCNKIISEAYRSLTDSEVENLQEQVHIENDKREKKSLQMYEGNDDNKQDHAKKLLSPFHFYL